MQRQGFLASSLRFLKKVALIDLTIFAAVGLFGFLNAWPTPHAYGAGLVFAGIAAMVVGGLTILGGASVAGDPTYMHALSSSDNFHGSVGQLMQERGARDSSLVLMAAAGAVAIALGELVKVVFP